MSDSATHPAQINRQIINEDLNRVIIAGQGTGAIVSVGTTSGPSQFAPNPASHSIPPGFLVDERIINKSGAGMFLLGQGSGAQTYLSEDFAKAAILHSQMPVKEQQQQPDLESVLQETKQAWASEREQLKQALAQRDLTIDQQAKKIVHLQDIIDRNALDTSYNRTRTNATCQGQVQNDRPNELVAVSQRVPQLATSNPILPELAESNNLSPKVTVSEAGCTLTSPPKEKAQRKKGLVKYVRVRLVVWFSPSGKTARDV